MKRLHRNFVVESKYPRKAAKEPARSIWGDADLKAIARQVEELLPQTATQQDKAAERRREGRILFDAPFPEASVEALKEPSSSQIVDEARSRYNRSAAKVALENVALESGERNTPSEVEPVLCSQMTSVMSTKSQSELPVISLERLVELEEEHKRLTSTLAQLLKAENARIELAISQLDKDIFDLR